MKKFLALLAILCLFLMPTLGWTEGTKVLQVPNTEIRFTVPEMSPDFFMDVYKLHVLGINIYANGNGLQIIEGLNDSLTVDVLVLVVKLFDEIHIIGMQVTYCPTGFTKLDMNKPMKDQLYTEYFEDVQFMKTGTPSDSLQRVGEITDYEQFKKYIEGTKI